MAKLIEMSFVLWTRVGPRKHVLDGMHIGASWQIRLNCPGAVTMQPFLSNYFDDLLNFAKRYSVTNEDAPLFWLSVL